MTNKQKENLTSLESIAGQSGVKFSTIKQDVQARGEIRLADFQSFESPVIADYRGKGKHLFFVQGKTKNWTLGATSLKRLEHELNMKTVIADSLVSKFSGSEHVRLYRNASFTPEEKKESKSKKAKK